MAIVVNDTFTDADDVLLTAHTGETGATWTRHPSTGTGDFRVFGNRIYLSTTPAVMLASGVLGTTACSIEADVYTTTALSGAYGIVGWVDASVATFYLFQYSVGSSEWQLQKCVGGVFTKLHGVSASLTTEQTYTIRLDLDTNSQQAYVNGVLTCSAADTAVAPAVRSGIRGSSGGSSSVSDIHFDRITVAEVFPNVAPVVTAPADATITTADTFTEGGSFTDSDGRSTSWTATVDYGEGAGPVVLSLNADKTFTLSNVFEATGVYTVTISVEDDGGLIGNDTVQVTVTEAPIIAYVDALPIPGARGDAPAITLP